MLFIRYSYVSKFILVVMEITTSITWIVMILIATLWQHLLRQLFSQVPIGVGLTEAC
jgi:hypothetical protein